eukprot:Clim_evm4s104 gene=Clim_evmTU4s104
MSSLIKLIATPQSRLVSRRPNAPLVRRWISVSTRIFRKTDDPGYAKAVNKSLDDLRKLHGYEGGKLPPNAVPLEKEQLQKDKPDKPDDEESAVSDFERAMNDRISVERQKMILQGKGLAKGKPVRRP